MSGFNFTRSMLIKYKRCVHIVSIKTKGEDQRVSIIYEFSKQKLYLFNLSNKDKRKQLVSFTYKFIGIVFLLNVVNISSH